MSALKIALVSTMYSPFQVELARAMNAIEGVEYHCFFTVRASTIRAGHWLADVSEEPWIHLSPGDDDTDPVLLDWLRTELSEIDPDVIIRTGILRAQTFRLTEQLAPEFPGITFGSWLEHPDLSRPLPVTMAMTAVARMQLRNVPLILAIGDRAQRYYRKLAPHADVRVVPYGQDLTPNFAIPRGDPPKVATFLMSGQLIRRNNIVGMVDAFERLSQSHPGQFRFIVAARGPEEHRIIKLMSSNEAFSRAVSFDRDYDTWNDRLRPFANADVLLAPYLHGGWTLVVPEAMAAGMPVISTRKVGAARYFVRPEVNGLNVQTSGTSIHAAMVRFVEDLPAIRRMGDAARQAAHEGDAPFIAQRFVEAACLHARRRDR